MTITSKQQGPAVRVVGRIAKAVYKCGVDS